MNVRNEPFSDLKTQIYSSLFTLIDRSIIRGSAGDICGSISLALSEVFGQTWLVADGHRALSRESFHSDLIRYLHSMPVGYLSIICIDIDTFCNDPNEVPVFLHSLISINKVYKRKVLFIDDPTYKNTTKTQLQYHKLLRGFSGLGTEMMARTVNTVYNKLSAKVLQRIIKRELGKI